MKLYDIIKDVAKTSLPDMEISDVTSDRLDVRVHKRKDL